MNINYADAERMVIEDQETSETFAQWLKGNRDKEPHEWDSDDLGEFFRSLGYETEDINGVN